MSEGQPGIELAPMVCHTGEPGLLQGRASGQSGSGMESGASGILEKAVESEKCVTKGEDYATT
jgi:hypothetical protein